MGFAVSQYLWHVRLGPTSKAPRHVVQRHAELRELVGDGDRDGRCDGAGEQTSRSNARRFWVSIFWLTPTSRREISEYRIAVPASVVLGFAELSPPSAQRIRTTHLFEIRSRSWRLGHTARKALYCTFALAVSWAAVFVTVSSLLRMVTHFEVPTSSREAP